MTKALLALIMAAMIFAPAPARAEDPVEIHYFWVSGCQYCEMEKTFLDQMEEKYPTIEVHRYSISIEKNRDILRRLIQEHPGSERYFGAVPMTFTGGEYFSGFDSSVGNDIEQSIKRQMAHEAKEERDENIYKLPFLGDIDTQAWSLGGLAVVIGSIDGLNVCSLGALMMILTMVFVLKSRKMTLVLGGMFVLVSSIMYGVLVLLWQQLFPLLFPYMTVMRIAIGLFALGGGLYFLSQFNTFRKQGVACKGSNNRMVASVSKRVEESFTDDKKGIWAIAGAVALFAAVVTVIEFPCSAVFPVVYAGILAQASLPLWLALTYVVIYLFFYMLIELVVLTVAVLTRQIWIVSEHFVTWASLVGAIVLFGLAYYYLFAL